MKTFYLHGDMADNFCEKIKLNVSTIREFFNSLSSNYPNFRKYFIHKSLNGVQYVFVDDNKDKLEHFFHDLPLKSSEYHVLPVVEGAAQAAAGFLGNFAMGYAMQSIMDKMQVIDDDGTPEYEIITTNSFIYKDNENTVDQGTPIPVVYGQLRVGSKVINSSIHNYDYNYDTAEIYSNPGDTYSKFVNPNNIIDYREDTPEILNTSLLPKALDPTKRSTFEGPFKNNSFAHQLYNADAGNETANYQEGNKSNQLKIVGPTNKANKPSWWNHAPTNNRPTLWGEGIDENMRPQTSTDLCVETISPSSKKKNHGFDRTAKLTVGDRGNYQKLESISIYKTIEVLSEGPIVGLSTPITGFDLDNGLGRLPYFESLDGQAAPSSSSSSSNSIKLGSLKFNVNQQKVTSLNNTANVEIISNGRNYPDFNGVVKSRDLNADFYINVDQPTTIGSADINEIDFSDVNKNVNGENDQIDGETRIISSSEIFMLRSSDGKLTFNSNTDGTNFEYFLDDKYINEETFQYNEQSVTAEVMNLRALSETEDLPLPFSMGVGYTPEDSEYTVSPNNLDPVFNLNIDWNSNLDRFSQAKVYDASNMLEGGGFGVSEDLNYILNQHSNSSKSKFLSSLPWEQLPRIYYDGDELNGIDTSTYFYVAIGTITFTQQYHKSFDNWKTVTTCTRTMYLRLTIGDYIGLGNWNRNDVGLFNGSTFQSYHSTSTSSIKSICGFTESNNKTYQYLKSLTSDSSITDDDYNSLSEYERDGFENHFDNAHWLQYLNGTSTSSVSIAPYINASKELSLRCRNKAIETIPNLKTSTFNGRYFLKFGVGTGSNLNPTSRINNLPTYMTTSNCDNFNQVYIEDDGSVAFYNEVGQEDIDEDRGYYHPFLFPRVTIFTLRANVSTGSVSVMPTSIEAVARISERGTVESLHLLHVPDLPVYDDTVGEFTPLYPIHENPVFGSVFRGSPLYRFYDSAIIMSIDPSSSSTPLKLRVDGSSFVLKSQDRTANSSIEPSFVDHIQNAGPTPDDPANGAGLFANASTVAGVSTFPSYNDPSTILKKSIQLNENNTKLSNSDSNNLGEVAIELENINLNDSKYKINSLKCLLAQSDWSTLCTGRPINASVSDGGSGYKKSNGDSASGELVTINVYPRSKHVSSISFDSSSDSGGQGLGYKPNDTFFIYGGNATYANFSTFDPAYAASYLRFKAKVKIDKLGKIDSITIVDPGYGFDSYLTGSVSHRTVLSSSAFWAHTLLTNNGLDLRVSNSLDIFPSQNFPKQDLIIRVAKQHIQELNHYGKISKFYIAQEGLGFISDQIIDNVFTPPNLSQLEFNVVIQNGSLQSMRLLGDSHEGYTEVDSSIKVRFPPPNIEIPTQASVESDDYAWAYGIYLNDTPIRDRNGYFNYSKFHFDIRSGHIKNGQLEKSISDFNIMEDYKSALMEKEYQYPSNTKMINYPLYGPRNNGEMDYYYTHTIKNPNVNDVVVSINIKELHYIYEGDESSVYVNLSPIIIVAMLFYLVTEAAQAVIESKTSSILFGGGGGGGGGSATVVPCTGTGSATVTVKVAVKVKNPGPLAKSIVLGAIVKGVIAAALIFIGKELGGLTLPCRDVPFLCFKVGEIVKNSGEIWPAKVYVNIEYGLEGEALTQETIAFRGCATNEYIKDIPIENLPSASQSGSNNRKNRIVKVYRTTREMDPVRQGIIEARYKIKAELHSVTEYINHSLSFPNTAIIGSRINSKDHPQIPKREYLIKGKLISIPSNYSALTGVYSGVWDGGFQIGWSSNPAWIIYDLLTNVTYGMGKYGILEEQVDKWSFYRFSEHCDERVDTVIDGVLNNGSPYQERRHMCNLYVDTEQEAYTYIQRLLSIYSASLNFSGNQIYITYDKQVNEDEVVMLFTNSNIHQDGFSYASTPSTSRITAVTVDYLDERDNYMRKSEYVEDPTYIAEHGYSHIKIPGLAITRKGEAHRLGWQKILTQQLEREIIEFKSGLQASYLKVGDVIDVLDNNKISKHYGGKILKIIDNRNIEIDVPASVISNATSLKLSFANTNYSQWTQSGNYIQGDIVYSSQNFLLYIKENNNQGTVDPYFDVDSWSLFENSQEKQFAEYNISSTNGFRITFSSDINENIKPGLSWVAVDDSTDNAPKAKPYRIKSIRETEEMIFEIIGIEYVDNKYNFVNESANNSSTADTDSYKGHTINV